MRLLVLAVCWSMALASISPAVAQETPDAFVAAQALGKGINLGNALEAPKEGEWGMVPGMWFSFMILIPVGAFLTYKAMHDSQVFNKDFYKRYFQKLPFFKRTRD